MVQTLIVTMLVSLRSITANAAEDCYCANKIELKETLGWRGWDFYLFDLYRVIIILTFFNIIYLIYIIYIVYICSVIKKNNEWQYYIQV